MDVFYSLLFYCYFKNQAARINHMTMSQLNVQASYCSAGIIAVATFL